MPRDYIVRQQAGEAHIANATILEIVRFTVSIYSGRRLTISLRPSANAKVALQSCQGNAAGQTC